MVENVLKIDGARVHNLKSVHCEIPHNALTIITGVSGSGKSSLAFDTIYAEGQRRYVESLSAYARQFLERMNKPDVDQISGICPAIAIQQKTSIRNPRSTVGTQTEIYDYLRLLFARVGTTYCDACSLEVRRDAPESIADEVLRLAEGTKFYVLFPASSGVPAESGGETRSALPPLSPVQISAHLLSLMQRGFNRFLCGERMIDLESIDQFPLDQFAAARVVVDRLAVRSEIRSRLIDSLETSYREGHGVAEIRTAANGGRFQRYSEAFECKSCKQVYPAPEPQLFSFNSAYGACPSCQGFGNLITLDMDLVIPNRALSLQEGAVDPWTKPQFDWAQEELFAFCSRQRIPTDVPFARLSKSQQDSIMQGQGDYAGIRGFFRWLETKKYKLHVRVFLSRYRGYSTCPDCQGYRLKRQALNVRIDGRSLPEVCTLSIAETHRFFEDLKLPPERQRIAERLLQEIRQRLKFLIDVGLNYLTLDRLSATLSGGESQRIQLATNLGSALVGTLYVLDEPSVGLHPRDNQRLIRILQGLRDIGNTVLVVEHDPDMMRAADHIIDLGPGAGESGGEITFEGRLEDLEASPRSLTGKYLSGEMEIPVPDQRRKAGPLQLRIFGATANNLKAIDVRIPLQCMVAVTGVSGSGKSTLVHDVIYASLKKQRGEWDRHVGSVKKIECGQRFEEIVLVDQSPIGRTPRSNPATYIKAFDAIREAFAETKEAQARGLDAAHFSFNVPGGRCETCQGDGVVRIEMQFLADVDLVCDDCKGTRYKSSILEIRYKGRTIHDVLNMTVREALQFFGHTARIVRKLRVLDEVGLGYLRIGQSATTLSGGEAQRIKLAFHLAQRTGVKSLFIFDEPTTGLHFHDIHNLLRAFTHLLDAGATILVIEHNLDVIKCADWVVDLGPEGGSAGGYLVAEGRPEQIVKNPKSHTGRFLSRVLQRQDPSSAREPVPASSRSQKGHP
ncbi:MAG: excinuclease ABC subunit UvrA [Acidobacteria bacterium]|nr:excinuclease ABC subunit UvrA [Acidobacteriota bacterium]